MSNEPLGNTTRRGFLGTATAATALTLTAPPASEAQAVKSVDEIQIAQMTAASPPQPAATSTGDWTKPAAMAIPKEGYFKLEQGRYGPVFPKTPANYGLTMIAKVKPGREQAIREHGKIMEKAVAESPSLLAPLKLHYVRWVLFNIGGQTYFMYQGIFDTDFDKLYRRCRCDFQQLGAHHYVRKPGRLPDGLENKRAGVRKVRARPSLAKLPGIRRVSVCDCGRSEESAQNKERVIQHA